MDNFMKVYELWLNEPTLAPEDRDELLSIKDDKVEIEDRFYQNLSFGTGGMRGLMRIGPNGMNIYTIRKATQGLANYIIAQTGDTGKAKGVAISYDSRNNSKLFAITAAGVLAGNGIKVYLFDDVRSTPELSFATRETGAQAGIMITASHNPKEYNGYKAYWSDGGQVVFPHDEGILTEVAKVDIFKDIKSISEKEAIDKGLLTCIGKEIDDKFISLEKAYAIHTDIPGKDKFKIVYTPLHGVGGVMVQRVLSETGFASVYTVPEQEKPNGNFPTVSYPNPEESKAFTLSVALADKVGAKICLATDPDADRVAVALKDKSGNWIYPTGNQIGVILLDYIVRFRKNLPSNGAVISTIVSTPMLEAIAEPLGLKVYRVLTGFKFIADMIAKFEQGKYDSSYVFGFEESIGYMESTHVRDKDSIISAMYIAEMAAYYDSIGSSILDELEGIYKKYGYYKEKTVSITKPGKTGLDEIAGIMTKLRNKTHDTINGHKVVRIGDYQESKEIVNGVTKPLDLPKSNVLQFVLDDKTYITARPSGTEPKIKYYLCVVGESHDDANAKLQQIEKAFLDYVEAL